MLAIGTKRKINKLVKSFPLNIKGLYTFANFNIITLGSYDVLIGMDLLDADYAIMDCYKKIFTCLDEEGNQ